LRADRWQIARALLRYESGIREQLSAAVKAHGDADRFRSAREAVEGMISALRPAWSDRLGAIRTACLETLKSTETLDADRLHQEADLLFELFATSDERAPELLAAIDGGGGTAQELIARLRELAAAAQALQAEPPPPPTGRAKDVA